MVPNPKRAQSCRRRPIDALGSRKLQIGLQNQQQPLDEIPQLFIRDDGMIGTVVVRIPKFIDDSFDGLVSRLRRDPMIASSNVKAFVRSSR